MERKSKTYLLVRVMRDTCGVVQASVYDLAGHSLSREATLGEPDEATAPVAMPVDGLAIAALSLEKKALVTVRDLFLKDGSANVEPPSDTPLAAIPLIEAATGHCRGLVLVHRMQFSSLTWRTFARLQSICRWVDRNRRPDVAVAAAATAPALSQRFVSGSAAPSVAGFAEAPEA